MSRRAWGFVKKPVARASVKQPLVQILVEVAIRQMETLSAVWGRVPCEQQLDMG